MPFVIIFQTYQISEPTFPELFELFVVYLHFVHDVTSPRTVCFHLLGNTMVKLVIKIFFRNPVIKSVYKITPPECGEQRLTCRRRSWRPGRSGSAGPRARGRRSPRAAARRPGSARRPASAASRLKHTGWHSRPDQTDTKLGWLRVVHSKIETQTQAEKSRHTSDFYIIKTWE